MMSLDNFPSLTALETVEEIYEELAESEEEVSQAAEEVCSRD